MILLREALIDAALIDTRVSKIHTAVDALGHPLRFTLTPGQASDCTQAEPLLAGFPAQYVIADKGYDSQTIVEAVERSGAQAVSPPRACVKGTVE